MATNNSANNATAASGKVLQGQGVGTASAFSTATYPATATTTGQILRADGTNWVGTTATYPNTAGTSGNVLTSDGTNWTSSAASGNVSGPGSSTDRAIATWNGTGGTALFNNSTTKIDSTGRQTNSAQPCFFAYLGTTVSSVTGDLTDYHIAYDSVSFDQGSNFTTGSAAKFTAPIAGKYMFSWGVLTQNVVAQTSAICKFNSTFNTATPTFCLPTPFATGGNFAMNGSIVISMAVNDTAFISVQLGGSTKTVNVNGTALPTCSTFFSGYLIC